MKTNAMKFRDFENEATTIGTAINGNMSNVYSCLKVCFGFNIESDALVKIAWREYLEFFQTRRSDSEVYNMCRDTILPNFYRNFKIVAR